MKMTDWKEIRARQWGIRVLATLGLIAILALGAWGVARLAMSIPSIFSSIGAAAVSLTSLFVPAESISIKVNSGTVISDEPFEIAWEHARKREEGTYTVHFGCRDALAMQTLGQDGSYKKVFCETPFNFTNAQNSIKLIPTSHVRFLDVPFTLTFMRNDGSLTLSDELTLTVVNEKAGSTPSPSTPTSPRTPSTPSTPSTYTITTAGRPSDPRGKPDLYVRILSLGSLSGNTFVPAQSIRPGERAAVRFEVENIGTRTAEHWSFNAALPTSPFHIFHSDTQPALGPGDKIVYTLGFDQVSTYATGGVITLNVDPTNSLFELNEHNNIVKGTYIILINR